jgi:ubiquinone/menaquinone biosynthesis C-methylase UbiE
MESTGERLVTSLDFSFGVAEHLHRYALAMEIVKDKLVLDLASGEGYGSNLIADKARKVFGVDISQEAVSHAKGKYKKDNLEFLQGAADKIPLPDNSVDVVVSFETIEHHDQHEKMFSEMKRVLHPDGMLILSSPEKSVYYQRDPENKFHIKEITIRELETLVTKYFKYHKFYTQQVIVGSLVLQSNRELIDFATYDGDFKKITDQLKQEAFFNKPFFNIVVCSDVDR